MVSTLDSGASGPVSSPGRGHWTRRFNLTVLLSTQEYKWVPANLELGVTLRWSMLTNPEYNLSPDGPLGSYADFTPSFAFLESGMKMQIYA